MSAPAASDFEPTVPSRQVPARAASGVVGAGLVAIGLVAAGAVALTPAGPAAGAVVAVLALSLAPGLVVVQPNDSRVLVFFGRYVGSLTRPGFYFVNPSTAPWRQSVLLRVRDFQAERIKVNDAGGSPIEIAAVVVWRVVGLVDMALRELGEQGTVTLTEDRKAAMAANLLVVLSSDRGASPVIDACA